MDVKEGINAAEQISCIAVSYKNKEKSSFSMACTAIRELGCILHKDYLN